MVSIADLWAPILLSAVIVFFVSAIMHMVLPYHYSDFSAVPNEDAMMDALRPFGLTPGDYMLPKASSAQDMKNPAFAEKCRKGPKLIMTVLPPGLPGIGPQLAQWFVFCIVVSVFAAYVASRAVLNGEYLEVFRYTGVTAFAGYALALWPASIWYKRKWSTSIKETFDGLVFALLTAGTFGWLWPR